MLLTATEDMSCCRERGHLRKILKIRLIKPLRKSNITQRDLWDSVAARTSNVPITDAQKAELDCRLAKRATEKPSGVSLDHIAQKLGVTI
ncbi:addiction module protein [Undibacterium sp.]|uniref:addiction module protein n=1 Tax=Undibacterium sp. TaxID=1914977 RepID=UPI003753C1C8